MCPPHPPKKEKKSNHSSPSQVQVAALQFESRMTHPGKNVHIKISNVKINTYIKKLTGAYLWVPVVLGVRTDRSDDLYEYRDSVCPAEFILHLLLTRSGLWGVEAGTHALCAVPALHSWFNG